GSGAREHCIAWKLSQSEEVKKIFVAEGNGGTAIMKKVENVGIESNNIAKLKEFATKKNIELIVVGPEMPLANGIVDEFEDTEIRVFGPNKEAGKLESSKVFAKLFMKRHNIPTAEFAVFDNFEDAKREILNNDREEIVVKADGLAYGKGVLVCNTKEEAIEALHKIMVERIFGEAGNKVVLEERLYGTELSYMVISDGKNFVQLQTSQDHKQIYDNDKGPNTGGMGAYSPVPFVDKKIEEKIIERIVKPTISGMEKEGTPFKGVLYAGLMLVNKEPYVLEFNVRFGDPEAQVILPKLNSDLATLLLAASNNELNKIKVDWQKTHACCVVLASKGYPLQYEIGKQIILKDSIDEDNGEIIFHAGTKLEGKKLVTNGGRVLNAVGIGKNLKEAIAKAYRVAEKIEFENKYYRKDIGKKGLNYAKKKKI
ncbi:MAG: phosphoribosylamine--glycine ligase, partial [Candidatus Diapherotrites archaeon]|nr:phosphoribosylamine--glycine ligase [Candidatus Diapherotrites archaeon]